MKKSRTPHLKTFTVLCLILSFIGTIHAASADRTLYRCWSSPAAGKMDHLLSVDPNCEGLPHSDGVIGMAYSAQVAGTIPLYRCRWSGGHFETFNANCENAPGAALDVTLAYVFGQNQAGLTPLYRCNNPNLSDHLSTVSNTCENAAGYTLEGGLGYLGTPLATPTLSAPSPSPSPNPALPTACHVTTTSTCQHTVPGATLTADGTCSATYTYTPGSAVRCYVGMACYTSTWTTQTATSCTSQCPAGYTVSANPCKIDPRTPDDGSGSTVCESSTPCTNAYGIACPPPTPPTCTMTTSGTSTTYTSTTGCNAGDTVVSTSQVQTGCNAACNGNQSFTASGTCASLDANGNGICQYPNAQICPAAPAPSPTPPIIHLGACQAIQTPGNYQLDNDLTAAASCFPIQADGVTFDCKGHSLSGPGACQSDGFTLNNRNGVGIQNCVVRNFEQPLNVQNSQNVRIVNNTLAAYAAYSTACIGRGTMAVHAAWTNQSTFENNTVNTLAGTDGIWLLASSNNRISSNRFGGQGSTAINIVSDGAGRYGNANRVYRNWIQGAYGDAISLGTSGNTADYNSVTGNASIGIYFSAQNNNVTGNRIFNNAFSGSNLGFSGISAYNAGGSIIAENLILNNANQGGTCRTNTDGSSGCDGLVLQYGGSGNQVRANVICGTPLNLYCNPAGTAPLDSGNNVCDPAGARCGIACQSGCAAATVAPLPPQTLINDGTGAPTPAATPSPSPTSPASTCQGDAVYANSTTYAPVCIPPAAIPPLSPIIAGCQPPSAATQPVLVQTCAFGCNAANNTCNGQCRPGTNQSCNLSGQNGTQSCKPDGTWGNCNLAPTNTTFCQNDAVYVNTTAGPPTANTQTTLVQTCPLGCNAANNTCNGQCRPGTNQSCAIGGKVGTQTCNADGTWANCTVSGGSLCRKQPDLAHFGGSTTNVTGILADPRSELRSVNGFSLEKPGVFKLTYRSAVDLCGQNFDDNVAFGAGFFALNDSNLSSSLIMPNQSVSVVISYPATILHPTLLYASGFHRTAAEILQVAAPCPAAKCQNVAFVNGNALFDATSFSDFLVNDTSATPTPSPTPTPTPTPCPTVCPSITPNPSGSPTFGASGSSEMQARCPAGLVVDENVTVGVFYVPAGVPTCINGSMTAQAFGNNSAQSVTFQSCDAANGQHVFLVNTTASGPYVFSASAQGKIAQCQFIVVGRAPTPTPELPVWLALVAAVGAFGVARTRKNRKRKAA